MKTKLALALTVGFVLGFLTQRYLPPRWDTGRHWHAVWQYMAYVRNPANARPDPSGLSVLTPPEDDPEPHLAALVAAGELEHWDVVFPHVPQSNRDAAKHWMAFCESHPEEVVYAYGVHAMASSPSSPRGEPLLHLHLWYKRSAKDLILRLVREIDAMGTKR